MKVVRYALIVVLILFDQTQLKAATFSTIAGTGAAGVTDGPARLATFLLPDGIIADGHGTIYVSDFLGQRIRRIDNDGFVRTIAGGGPTVGHGLYVVGDYVDGDPLVARFNGPAGLALDGDGRLFVADSSNNCIRIVSAAGTSTYAGSPTRTDGDGPITTAGFLAPRALAFDQNGTLWVGDRHGLRSIAQQLVSSIPLPNAFAKRITSIVPYDGRLMILNGIDILNIDPRNPSDYQITKPEVYNDEDPPNSLVPESRAPAGLPFAATRLHGPVFVYTDPVQHAVRFLNGRLFATLSRRPLENGAAYGGGFANGPTEHAKVSSPLGVTRLSDTSVALADSGNRQIRLISDIDTRYFADSTLDPFEGKNDPKKFYRIACFSNSYGAYGLPFDQTSAGVIERLLSEHAAKLHLARRPVVAILRVPSASAIKSYVDNVITEGVADAVVWLFNASYADSALNELRPAEKQVSVFSTPVATQSEWDVPLRTQIKDIRSSLRRAGIPLYVAAHPIASEFPASEVTWNQMTYFPGEPSVFDGDEALFCSLFADDRSRFVDLWPAFYAAERAPQHKQLFGAHELHFSSYGQRVVGEAIYKLIVSDHPWEN